MATTITSLGSYSKRIDVSDETRVTPIISAFDTALTAMGWSVHDTVVSGSRNCMTTKVYSAVNDDDSTSPTTKYVILRFDAPKGFIYMTCAESWNATTHVVTNESYDFERSFPMTLQTSNMSYYIFASARYMMIHPVFLGESGIWQGVFEWQRNPAIEQDTAATGAPCFGYTNGIIFGEAYATTYNNSSTTLHQNYSQNIVPPRTLDGYTGYGASKTYAINTAFGGIPANTFSLAEGSTSNGISPFGLGKIGTILTILDSSKKIVINPSLTSKYNKYIDTGKIYGLTLTQPIGNSLDTTNLTVDADGFYSDTGSSATHYVMNLSGGNVNGISQLSGSLKIKDTLPVSTQSSHLVNGVVVRGKYLYATPLSNTSLHKIDISTGAETVLTFTDGYSAYNVDIIFDGEDHIYVSRAYNSTNSYVVRINVNDDTMEYYPNLTSMGAGQLALDDDRLYVAAARWIMNNNNIRIFNRSESPASATVIANYSNTTTPFNSSHAVCALETTDYSGKLIAFYLYYSNSGNGVASNRFVVINGSNGTADYVKAYITVNGSNQTSESYIATGYTSNSYPDFPLVQWTPQWISLQTKGKAGQTSYGWGPGYIIAPSGTYDGVVGSDRLNSYNVHSTWWNMFTNDVGTSTNSIRRKNVFWKGYNLARITNYNSEYMANYGNYDWIKGVAHSCAPGRTFISGNNSADGRWTSYPQMFNTAFGGYSEMKTYMTDGTFLYTLGNSMATNNFIYNNQMSNKNNFGQAMPSILIRK